MLKPVATVALVLASLMTTASLAYVQTSSATKPGFKMLVPSRVIRTRFATHLGARSRRARRVLLSTT